MRTALGTLLSVLLVPAGVVTALWLRWCWRVNRTAGRTL